MTPPAASAAGRTIPRTVAPRAPRRVSGPARPNRRDQPQPRRRAAAPANDPFVVRAIHRTIALSDSRFLDRLIRGRLWIPLVAAGLMGIVFMQVTMLKLNAGIGRAVETAGTLERQNADLRAQVSQEESGSRVDAVAKNLGMVAPATTTSPVYVNARAHGLVAAAARRMTPADPDAILRDKQAVAEQSTSGTGGTGTTTPTAATTTATTTPAVATTPVTPPSTPASTTTSTTGTATTAATGTSTSTGATGAPSTGAVGSTTGAPTSSTGAAVTGAAAGGTAAATAGTTSTGTSSTGTSGGAVAPTAG
jgi:hypothetical protein